MDKERFGSFIADQRRATGMTQQALAQKLHVTNTAVSKWERGLCYPDVTLLEDLAETLDLTVSELVACRKEEAKKPDVSDGERDIHSLLGIVRETTRLHRRKTRILAGIIAAAVLLAVAVVAYFTIFSVHDVGYTKFVGKQMEEGVCYVYMEKNERLLRLECPDQESFNRINAEINRYLIEYRWNRLTMQGRLESLGGGEENMLGTPMDEVGSIISVDDLLGSRCVFNHVKSVQEDPKRAGGYLYTFRFYYESEKTGMEIPLVTVSDCRGFVIRDYDDDGIRELFVLTKYDEAPYRVYDVEDGKVVSRFVNEVSPEIDEQLRLF